jgi:hypothetical protein
MTPNVVTSVAYSSLFFISLDMTLGKCIKFYNNGNIDKANRMHKKNILFADIINNNVTRRYYKFFYFVDENIPTNLVCIIYSNFETPKYFNLKKGQL